MKRPLLVDLFLLKVGTVLKKKKNLESLNIISVQNLFKLTLPDVLSWSNQSGIPLKHNNDKGTVKLSLWLRKWYLFKSLYSWHVLFD